MSKKGKINRNIYKLDDICLIISYLLAVLLFFIIIDQASHIRNIINSGDFSLFDSSGIIKGRYILPVIVLILIIFLQVVGRIVRKKEI